MFDLERHVAQWRCETEATLAFSTAELDELEDHLRAAFDARLKAGSPAEAAWTRARADLGPASALALEFAKDKLMPALGRLLLAWWQPLLLLALFVLAFRATFDVYAPNLVAQPPPPFLWVNATFWLLSLAAIFLTLVLLRTRAQRVGLLAGVGNAIALLPLIHLALYNSVVERWVRPGWSAMSGSTGVAPVAAGIVGLVGINLWARRRTHGEERPIAMIIAGTLVFLLALNPVCCDFIGNLALRSMYELPAPASVTYRGDALVQFNNWWFVGTLFKSMVLIAVMLPLVLVAAGGFLAAALGSLIRPASKTPSARAEAFPAPCDLPWILALAATCVVWLIGRAFEPSFALSLHEMEPSILHRGETRGGLEIMILCSIVPFFLCVAELTRRLFCAQRVRPFYAALVVVVIGLGMVVLKVPLPNFKNSAAVGPATDYHTALPEWLAVLSCLVLLTLVIAQICLIRARLRAANGEVSLWKFTGTSLVEFGLTGGLVLACAAAAIVGHALVLARVTVIYIKALLTWGRDVHANPPLPFHPPDYLDGSQLFQWVMTGPGALFLFLAVGLGLAMILSALEFIRFNAFRLYRLRKFKGTGPVAALNK